MTCYLPADANGINLCWGAGGAVTEPGGKLNATTIECRDANVTGLTSTAASLNVTLTCVKNGAGRKLGLPAVMTLLLFLLSALAAVNATVIVTDGGNITIAGDPGADYLTVWASQSEIGDQLTYDNSITTLVAVNGTTDKRKRQYCTTYTFKQTQVAQAGTWQTCDQGQGWYPVSACYECKQSGSCGSVNFQYSASQSWSYSYGFDLGTVDDVLKILNAKFNFGYTYTRTTSKSNNYQCNVPGYGKGQVFACNYHGWSDSQTRTVTTNTCSGANNYGPWSAYQHADWALDMSNINSYRLGCSSGVNYQCA